MQAREDLTNVQFSILIRKEKRRHVYEPACKTNEPCCEFNESFFELVRQSILSCIWNISQSDIHFG